jgi:putative hemolysin
MWLDWILITLLVILDLFFTMIRAAFVNVRLPQLIDLGSHEPEKVEQTIKFLERPRLRATLRFLVGLAHVLITGYLSFVLVSLLEIPSIVAFLGILALVFIFLMGIELVLERIPMKDPEKWAIELTPMGRFLDGLFSPITEIYLRVRGVYSESQRQLGSVTEDELKTWVEVGQPEGGLEPDERKMIYSIFQFGETLCREIMIPRPEVLALEVKTPLSKAIDLLVESGHSRVPVYDDSIDNIVGMLYAKDLLKTRAANGEKQTIQKFLRPPYFVPESKKVDELLAEMQAKGVHIAIVVDEYGGMAGLVTLEDIVEEIVGEIRDEYDQGEELLIEEIDPDNFLFRARVSLDDFNETLDTHLFSDQTDTLGGYIYGCLGRVPVAGDSVEVEHWLLTVEDVRNRRIGRIRAHREKTDNQEKIEDAS